MVNARVLVVEDESIVAKDIEVTLKSLGYIVVGTANKGEDAIKKSVELSPNVVLMDIRLSNGMDGIQVAQEIKKKMDVPIIYLTAYSDAPTLERAKITEPFGYIMKPFAEKDLNTAIEIAVHNHRMERKLADSEKKYKHLYNSSPDGLVTLDSSGGIIEANETFTSLLGYRGEEIVDENIKKFIYETALEEFKNVMDRSIGKGSISNIKIEFKTKDSRIIPTLINSNVTVNDRGNMVSSSWVIRDISDITKLEKEKANLAEKVIKLTRKIPLTDNEKKVLSGLVSVPYFNDIELSKKLKIKRSTITAIKNKLKREAFYASYRIPHFPSLGCELIALVMAKLNPNTEKQQNKQNLLDDLQKIPECVYILSTNTDMVCVTVSKNFTELKKQMDSVITSYTKEQVIAESSHYYFPFETSRVHKFLDFSKHLALLFDLKEIPLMKKKTKIPKREFARKEKQAFYALVKYGNLNDSEIAGKTGLPRASISQIRRKLTAEGILQEMNIPNPLQLRNELIVLKYIEFDPAVVPEKLNSLKQYIDSLPSTFAMVSGPLEVFSLNVYSDYSSYEEERQKLAALITGENVSSKIDASTIFPVPQLKMEAVNYASLVKKNLLLNNVVDF